MQQSHPSTHRCRSRLCPRASTKPSFLGMQLMVHRSLHTFASHRDCTDHALDGWWREKEGIRRSSPSQGSSSSMDGECSPPLRSRPMCPKLKMCRTRARLLVRPALRRQKTRRMPGSTCGRIQEPNRERPQHATRCHQSVQVPQSASGKAWQSHSPSALRPVTP